MRRNVLGQNLPLLGVLLLVLTLAACGIAGAAGDQTPPPGTQADESQAEPQELLADYVGKMTLTPSHGPVGTLVEVTGSGLPANTTFDLVWDTVVGSWVLKGEANEEYHGREFTPLRETLQQVTSNAQGNLSASFRAPEDYGFNHDVMLVEAGVIRNKGTFKIDMEVDISPKNGPVGTPITITARGVGWQNLENSWMLLYDNNQTGWISSVTTRGTATATITATGQPGKHLLEVIHGSFTFAYRNMQQSPYPDRPTFVLEFTVTDEEPVLPRPIAEQSLPLEPGPEPAGSGTAAWVDPASGPVGTPLTISARGLTPGETVQFHWFRVTGNRIEGSGWSKSSTTLGEARVNEAGTVVLEVAAPDDLGGPHPIVLARGEEALAETAFNISPSAFVVEPASGPVGTEFTIRLKGVGWTETANIYTVLYDNSYIGYSCGFNSQGDVEIHLRAAGAPGWHYIDLYPAIYKGKDVSGLQNFRIPQLTYAEDHPGEKLPAFRFAFKVTE